MCQRGLHASIIVPTAVIGPHDYKPSRMGKAICDMANNRMPLVLRVGFEGVLDEIRIYSRALTQAEVQAIQADTAP